MTGDGSIQMNIQELSTALHFGCTIADEAIAVNRWQQTSVANIYAAGECTGFGGGGGEAVRTFRQRGGG